MPSSTKILHEILENEEKLLKKEKQIDTEEKKVLAIGEFLEKQETKELREEKKIERELNPVQKYFITQIKDHKFIFQIIIVVAVVLLWRGLWGIFDGIPFISSFIVSALLGFLLLWLFNKFTDAN